MYAKIYSQIFDSSIASDYETRHVFMDLLVLADVDGVIDMTYDAIARRTNMPLDKVVDCIGELMKPEPASRSGKANGARLVFIDPERDWGWKIVNYDHYRNLRDEESRRGFYRGNLKAGRRNRSGYVYYALWEDRARIALSANPWARIGQMKEDYPGIELAAKESGDEGLLRQRHQQFAKDQIAGEDEWFRLTARLQDHIATIVATERISNGSRVAKGSQQGSTGSQQGSTGSHEANGYHLSKGSGYPGRVAKRSQRRLATIKEEEEENKVPSNVPLAGGQGSLDFKTAKEFFNQLFGRTKRKWSAEEEQLLFEIAPIDREDAALITMWFRLPADHPVWNVTKRKQQLTTLLRDFNGELDKIKKFAVEFGLSGRLDKTPVKKEEPPRWKEFFNWEYDRPRLPASFWDLDRDLQQVYSRGFAKFMETASKMQHIENRGVTENA